MFVLAKKVCILLFHGMPPVDLKGSVYPFKDTAALPYFFHSSLALPPFISCLLTLFDLSSHTYLYACSSPAVQLDHMLGALTACNFCHHLASKSQPAARSRASCKLMIPIMTSIQVPSSNLYQVCSIPSVLPDH